MYILMFTAVLMFVSTVKGFNIDTFHPTIYSGNNDSYFGYSVAILKNSEGSWLLVGAPKDQDIFQPQVTRPGVLYKCPFPREPGQQCSQVKVDSTGNTEQLLRFHGKNIKFHHHKNNQWLGVSLDVRPDDHSSVLVCAHRWADSFLMRNLDDISHMNGMCYQISGNLSTPGRLVPALTKLRRLVNRRLRYAEFSMGSLGVSAKFTDEGGKLLMGAPGLNDWSGGLAIERESDAPSDLQYIEPAHTLYRDSYIGYAMTTGSYLSRSSKNVALGAPKSGHTGKVLIFDLSDPKNSPQRIITGNQIGSYFGSALCTVKVNSDGWDDILVGAPLHQSTGSEQGRVFVYISRGPMGFLKSDTELSGSTSINARFGSAIVNLGDINKDGFQDIAVGAPYEDNMKGAVYVFLGYRSGVWPVASQKISARNLDIALGGFGSSFSRPYDIDGNGYNDIAVGAHISNQAVLLRTRPINNLGVTFIVAPRRIDPNRICTDSGLPYACARVKFCFGYKVSGQPVPEKIEMRYTLRIDINRGFRRRRAVFIQTLNKTVLEESVSLTGSLILSRDARNCSSLQTFFLKNTDDPFEDIVVELKFEDIYRTSDSILPMSAPYVANKNVQRKQNFLHRKIAIKKNCGFDDLCHSNLQLLKQTLTFGDAKYIYVIDDVDYVGINISLRNNGEMAYSTKLNISLPYNLSFMYGRKAYHNYSDNIVCFSNGISLRTNTYYVICDIGDVSMFDGVINVFMQLAVRSEFLQSIFSISSTVQTLSDDSKTSGNETKKSLVSDVKVDLTPKMRITGFSIPERRFLMRYYNDTVYENVAHRYDLTNLGPSMLIQGTFTVFLPAQENFINIQSVKADRGLHCNIDRDVTFEDGLDTRTSLADHQMIIDCTRFPCVSIKCQIHEMPSGQSFRLKVYLTLWKKIVSDHKDKRHFRVESVSVFTYSDDQRLIIKERKIKTKISTEILKYEKTLNTDELMLWVVLVSFCGGVILFMVLGLLLLKVGFFKRRYREDLITLRKLRYRHCGRSRTSSEEECNENEGSNENLVITTDYRTVTYDHSGESSSNSPVSRTFEDTDYLEPIKTLLPS